LYINRELLASYRLRKLSFIPKFKDSYIWGERTIDKKALGRLIRGIFEPKDSKEWDPPKQLESNTSAEMPRTRSA